MTKKGRKQQMLHKVTRTAAGKGVRVEKGLCVKVPAFIKVMWWGGDGQMEYKLHTKLR